MRVVLCLPAYNEEPSIPRLFPKILELQQQLPSGYSLEVVLYDDGSTDATVKEAMLWQSQLSLEIVQGDRNRGLGHALRELLEFALSESRNFDVAVIMDCDDTHDPLQILEMLPLLVSHDVVIASRFQKTSFTSGVPAHRLVASYGFMLLCRAILPIPGVRDYSCGFRGYKTNLLAEVRSGTHGRFIQEDGFASMPELLEACFRHGATMTEIPMRLAYDQKLSSSKMPVAANTRALLSLLRKWRRAR